MSIIEKICDKVSRTPLSFAIIDHSKWNSDAVFIVGMCIGAYIYTIKFMEEGPQRENNGLYEIGRFFTHISVGGTSFIFFPGIFMSGVLVSVPYYGFKRFDVPNWKLWKAFQKNKN